MTANIIHNITETERFQLLIQQIEKQKINPVIWTGMLGFETKTNISKAHKQVVKWAKEKGKSKVLIMEDDVLFYADDGYDYFLENEPPDYDIYLGGLYYSKEKISEQNKKVKQFNGLHCYMLHSRFYDEFLNIDETQSLDIALGNLAAIGQCKIKCVYPFAALQQEIFSTNLNYKINNERILREYKVYGANRNNR